MADYSEGSVTTNDQLEQLLQDLLDFVDNEQYDLGETGYELLRDRIVTAAFEQLGQLSALTPTTIDLMESIVIPAALAYDRGWNDLPEGYDSTMNGVSVRAFVNYHELVFKQDEYTASIIDRLRIDFDWVNSEELRKHILNRLCSSERVAALFYYMLACSPEMRYPIAIMVADPCAGYLLMQWAFETIPQDGSFYKSSNLDGLGLRASEQDGITLPTNDNIFYAVQWLSETNRTIINETGPNFVLDALAGRERWILSSTSPVETNPLGSYQVTWRERLLSDSDSQLATLIKINNEYNLNSNDDFVLEDKTDYYAALGAAYKTKLDPLGYTILSGGGYVELTDASLDNRGLGVVDSNGTVAGGGSGGGGGANVNTIAGGDTVEGAQAALPSLSTQLKIKPGGGGFLNDFAGSQVLINSDRIILNSRTDYLMLFGGAGVSISSREPVNIDTNSTVTVFGEEGVYLGLPNKGEPYDPSKPAPPKSNYFGVEAGPTTNNETGYEPAVLGEKLADIIDDLLITLINSTSLNPVGTGAFREDVIYNLKALRARVPEMLSTAIYMDGISHEPAGEFPTPPTTLSNSGGVLDVNAKAIQQISGIVGANVQARLAASGMVGTGGATPQISDPLSSVPGYFNSNSIYGETSL
jgi:hypothetical protein